MAKNQWKRPPTIQRIKGTTLEIDIKDGPRIKVCEKSRAVYIELRQGRRQEGKIKRTLEVDEGILLDQGPSPDGYWTKGVEILY